jgi:hypothetical protein
MNEASSLARNPTAAAISAGVPIRPNAHGATAQSPVPDAGAAASVSVAIQSGTDAIRPDTMWSTFDCQLYRRHGVASLAHCFKRGSRLVEEDTTGSRKPRLSRTANEELSAERDRCRAISVLADSQLSAVS